MKIYPVLSVVITAFCLCAVSVSAERKRPAPEVDGFREWLKKHPPKVKTLPPPTDEQTLGKALFADANLSLNHNQSCATCHSLSPAKNPATGKSFGVAGFVDPDNVTTGTAVSRGSVPDRFGVLNAPSVAYAAFSPEFHWDGVEAMYRGGQFWNGRAANLQAQAAEPFLVAFEMGMPSKWAVVTRLKGNPLYQASFLSLFGIDLKKIPGRENVSAATQPPPGVLEAYEALTRAIATFEKTRSINRFTSKFDFYLAGMTELSPKERHGMEVFNFNGLCFHCHVSNPSIAPDGTVFPPLFTDHSYANIGVPRNTTIPGNSPPSLGLGGRKDVLAKSPGGSEIGKHKVSSLRNVALTAPYGHNGVFATLEEIVHFYNTRETLGRVASDQDPGFGVTGWAPPEVAFNVNFDEVGSLNLSAVEEAALVAFLKTLTDKYPDTGGDPNVPPGTPSPFQGTPFPPFP